MKWRKRFSNFWKTSCWEVEDRVRINSRHAIFLSGEYTLAELEEIVDFVRRLTPHPADAAYAAASDGKGDNHGAADV